MLRENKAIKNNNLVGEKCSGKVFLCPGQPESPSYMRLNTHICQGTNNFKRLKKFSIKMKNQPTYPEKFLENFLKEKNIYFRKQVIISPYIVDFLLPQKGTIIELDGEPHSFQNQMTYDVKRDKLLNKLKLLVIRFTNKDVLKNPEKIMKIYDKLKNQNMEKINWRIATHNFNYKKYNSSFLPFKIKYFLRNFRYFLKKEITNALKFQTR